MVETRSANRFDTTKAMKTLRISVVSIRFELVFSVWSSTEGLRAKKDGTK